MSTRYVPLPGGPDPADLPSEEALIPLQPDPSALIASLGNSAASLDPPVGGVGRQHPRPFQNTLVAASKRITSASLSGTFRRSTAESWQNDAWEMYDLVGEMRFLVSTLANRMSQARLFVGVLDPDDPTAAPAPLEDPVLSNLLNTIGDGPLGMSNIMQRFGVNISVPGDSWLVGIPRWLLPENQDPDDPLSPLPMYTADGRPSMLDLCWKLLSVTEIGFKGKDTVEITLGDEDSEKIECDPDEAYLVRMWRQHPRRSWQADSPTRSSLPVLRELVGLTMHISAQIDSRLAGAGLLLVPSSAVRALKAALNLPEDSEDDPFTDALMDAMLTPIQDRSNASAVVPLVSVVPDESIEHFRLMTFDKPLDSEARVMREEAIRRYALGADAPPELLLGTAGMNHWGAWLVREDVVNTHIEPPLALFCDALTQEFLRPVMEEIGTYDERLIDRAVVWYDVSHMISRPNRAGDAQQVYDRGALADDSLRAANGFDESDAPTPHELVLKMVVTNPALITDPGVPALLEQIGMLLKNSVPPSIDLPGIEQPDADTGAEPDGSSPSSESGGPSDTPARTPSTAPPSGEMPSPSSTPAGV